jgi:hypothetical protein
MMAVKLLRLSFKAASVTFPSTEVFFDDILVSDGLRFVLTLSASGLVLLCSLRGSSVGIEFIEG